MRPFGAARPSAPCSIAAITACFVSHLSTLSSGGGPTGTRPEPARFFARGCSAPVFFSSPWPWAAFRRNQKSGIAPFIYCHLRRKQGSHHLLIVLFCAIITTGREADFPSKKVWETTGVLPSSFAPPLWYSACLIFFSGGKTVRVLRIFRHCFVFAGHIGKPQTQSGPIGQIVSLS
jgi:hypothetical protein